MVKTYRGTNSNNNYSASKSGWWPIRYWESWTMYGNGGSDTLTGSPKDDRIYGGEGIRIGSGFSTLPNDDDHLFGGDGNDRLYGETGNDQLFGGNGNDTLYGGRGIDRMEGGKGGDAYYVDSLADQVIEDPYAYTSAGWGGPNIGSAPTISGDTDTVYASVSGYTLTNYVENLQLTGSAAVGYGNSEDNKIWGTYQTNRLYGRDGDDWLYGRGGDDYLYGGEGDNHFDGGTGTDTLIHSHKNGGRLYLTDTTLRSDSTDSTFSSIEKASISGSNANDHLSAPLFRGSVVMRGAGGADRLSGSEGDDTLWGGTGDDVITGGWGNDFISGGSGVDTLHYTFYELGGDITLTNTRAVHEELGTHTLSSIEKVEMYGEIDSLDLDASAFSGELYIMGSGRNDTLTGGSGNDSITGNSGDDILNGKEGHDFLSGRRGGDILVGGGGNDTLQGAFDLASTGFTDRLTGGNGQDTFVLGSSSKSHYDDGDDNTLGDSDFALITDFNKSQDTIQLHGVAEQYRLGAATVGNESGQGIYVLNANISKPDELIAIVQGETNGLNLSANHFEYI